MNRRTFVQIFGAGAAGLLVAGEPVLGADPPVPPAAARVNEPIRLGNNENPYGPAPSALAAVAATAPEGHRYAFPAFRVLAEAIAEKHGAPREQVLLSGGSDDILRAAVSVFTGVGKALVTGEPSYESPVRTAMTLGSPITAVPLTGEQRLDLNAMAAASNGAGLLYICNPNNPTATAVTAAAVTEAIEQVLAASPDTHVLVDEAYFEYADLPGFATAIPLVERHPQVIVARTFSKIYGMAGMRVGYAVAQPATLDRLRTRHSLSGLSVMSLSAATAAVRDTAWVQEQVALNRATRKFTTEAFTNAGYTVAPSDANFIFVDIQRDARDFQEACRAENVLVGRAFPPVPTWTRISIGTMEEMKTALPVFMNVLSRPVERAA